MFLFRQEQQELPDSGGGYVVRAQKQSSNLGKKPQKQPTDLPMVKILLAWIPGYCKTKDYFKP